MEYFESVTLETFIKTHSYDQKTIFFIISQIFDCLDYLHRNSIVHRDFNLKNILIHPRTHEIKLIDFGLSRFCHNLDEVVSPQGNCKFRVPSIFEFSRNPYLADLWNAITISLSILTKRVLTTKKVEKLLSFNEEEKTTILKKNVVSILEKSLEILHASEDLEFLEENVGTIQELRKIFENCILI